MAKTTAERQAEYRARRLDGTNRDGDRDRRLNAWINATTHYALRRLAHRYGVTQREMIERLVIAEENRIREGIDPNSSTWDAYYNV